MKQIEEKRKKPRIIPVTLKIVVTFTIFLLVSNLSSNYINLVYNRAEQVNLMNQLIVKDLKDVYAFCNNQYVIYNYDRSLEKSVAAIEKKALFELKNSKALVLGIKKDGSVLFQSSRTIKKLSTFADIKSLTMLNQNLKKGVKEGFFNYRYNDENYFGVYKYNPKWETYIVRSEEENEFYQRSRDIFRNVSIVIIITTLLIAIMGIFVLRHILRYIRIISSSIMGMIGNQKLELIDMSKAPNDDITYLGVAFNALSSSIDNLVSIFQKFANQDVVQKAYEEREVKLEGTAKDLTILFTDIKSFTFITEILGNDIIKLLNLHYDRAIREIIDYDGVIGSIIGDALLAVYGAMDDTYKNKSYQAVVSGYRLHEVAESLRDRMDSIKDDIITENGKLTAAEKKVYKAVLLEIGVGIDGGHVFYGTIGSYVRMTNTVIGDNVNSASRLEGLTRIYKVPVICSEYVKNDIEYNVENHGIRFIELDTVQVKGKTVGAKVYWPIFEDEINATLEKKLKLFDSGLKLYMEGDWKNAGTKFAKCKLPLADEFKMRTKEKCPKSWNGIWEMKTK